MISRGLPERLLAADIDAPLLAVASGDRAVAVAPVDAEAAARLPASFVAPALERYTLTISNAVMQTMTAAERRSVPAFARFPIDQPVRSFGWPIVFREDDQPVPAVLRAFAGRVADRSCWSVTGLVQQERLAAHAILASATLTDAERDTLTESLHWSM